MKIEVSILAQNKIMKKAKQHILAARYLDSLVVKSIFFITVVLSYLTLTKVIGVDGIASLPLSVYVCVRFY